VNNIGLDDIAEYENELLAYATERLEKIEGLQIIGTSTNKASVISFIVEGTHPYDIGMILDKLGIAVRTGHHCTQPIMDRFGIPGTARASFSFYNTIEEIDRLAEGIERASMMLK
jgi:cysteine desulfurase/selenocysteine lyase